MTNRVIVFAGWPGRVGGAGTESFETQKFLIRHGLEVHCFPTWEDPDQPRRAELEALGVRVHVVKFPQVADLLRELGRPPIVTFINERVLPHLHRWRDLSPWIHIPCMTYVHSWERVAYKKAGPPDAIVFQSDFQRQAYLSGLARHRYPLHLGHSIRGAFCWDDWEFQPCPHDPGAPFAVCRIARPDPAKWSSQLFQALDPVPNIRATLLGVTEAARRNVGRRGYARFLTPGSMPVLDVLRASHAMVAMNSSAKENWPRVGLEAMACGVPVVADNKWGWQEMIRHGETGFLCGHAREFTDALRLLEADESLRHTIARKARTFLEHDLASPAVIWAGWQRVFRTIGVSHLAEEPKPATGAMQQFFYPEKTYDQTSVQRPDAGDMHEATAHHQSADNLRVPDEPPRCDSSEVPACVVDHGQDAAESAPQAAGGTGAEEIPPAEETPEGDVGRNDLRPAIAAVALEDSRPVGINTEPVTPSDLGLPDDIDGTPVEIHRGVPIMPPDPESSDETDDEHQQSPTPSRRRRKKRRQISSGLDASDN